MSEVITLPALGESVTEGTVTRWLKEVGEEVAADEPLLEVSTDKVDTEIPSPVAGVLLEIVVGEDETAEVGAKLAVVGAPGSAGAEEPGATSAGAAAASAGASPARAAEPVAPVAAPAAAATAPATPAAPTTTAAALATSAGAGPARAAEPVAPVATPAAAATAPATPAAPTTTASAAAPTAAAPGPATAAAQPSVSGTRPGLTAPAGPASPPTTGASAYVTPLVRKLASENGVHLSEVKGTGVGGRIRKQDVIAAAEAEQTAPAQDSGATPALEASPLRGQTVKMTRMRKVIGDNMMKALHS
ncbi:biotin/lipoyl-containing protein, partial [Streptomyces sp. NPDC006627]|uniref:biotin/lipoyl-containing protein n=1 Tax=Streptomyces sp. NPDC006627 TaxID=3154679 RepID=UPI0033A1DBEC